MSFYSRSLYQDVGKNWKKISFLYLFLLLSVCLIPVIFKIHSQVSDYLLREAPRIVKQVPVLTISKGIVTVNEKMPYIIGNPENNKPLIIIDTTGQFTSLSGSDAIALLTKTKLIIKTDSSEIRLFDLADVDSLRIDQPKLYEWIETFSESFGFILYPIALLVSFLFRIIQALIFAAIGILFARPLKVSLRYQALVSLSIVSMTPAILLDTLYKYVGNEVPSWWLINFLITISYLFFAVKANTDQEMTRDA
jgi:hypothetical protein